MSSKYKVLIISDAAGWNLDSPKELENYLNNGYQIQSISASSPSDEKGKWLVVIKDVT